MSNGRPGVIDVLLRVGLYGFVIGCYQGIAITQSALILGLLVWAVRARMGRTATPPGEGTASGTRLLTPVDLAFLFWLGSGILSTVFAVDPLASLDKLRKIFMIGTVYLFAFNVRSETRLERVVLVFLLSALVASAIGIVDYLSHPFGVDGRTRGTLSHYMTMGGLLMFAASLSVSLALFAKAGGWRAVFLWVCAAANTACLAVTFTRSAWIGFLAAVVTIFAFKRRVLLLVLPVVLVLFYVTAPGGFQERIQSMVDPSHPANVERTHMWRAGLEIFKDHPLAGVGLMDQSELYEQYRSSEARESHGHFHNIFVQVAAARGILGLAAFVYLLWAMGAAILRGRRAAQSVSPFANALATGAFGAYLGFILSGLFEWNFGDSEVIMVVYFLVGLAIAITRCSERVGSDADCSA
jgi:O-antigen ligase